MISIYTLPKIMTRSKKLMYIFSHVHITSFFLYTAMRCDIFKVYDISRDISHMYHVMHIILVPGYIISYITDITDIWPYFMILYDILEFTWLARGRDLCRTGKALARYLTICARYVLRTQYAWMIQQRFLLREVIWHVYVCLGGVMQTAVLLQSRHHHENVYVVFADGKRSTNYIISIYDGIKLAPIKRSLPSCLLYTSPSPRD